jgi:hypothetical protein
MPPMSVDVRMFKRRLKGYFAEFGSPVEIPQSNRWQMGQKIAANDSYQGVCFDTPLLEGHSVFGVIDGGALGRVEQTDHYSFLWDGKRIAKIGHYRLQKTFDTVGEIVEAERQPDSYLRSG